ncbi:MAG: DUF4124 domain-containing protein [Betaproteobacteria bacterium]|nr:MAG: DUF4124 domain-containing protein [Betaproteobacteria bacterium]
MLYAASAWAEICMFQDAQGNVTYTNVAAAAPKGAKKIRCFQVESPPPVSSDAPQRTESRRTEPPGRDFPTVDRETQRERDAERLRILEQELAAEQRRLAQARQELQEQESVRTGEERNYQRFLDRVQPYQEAVETHERNVQALQREINNLR